MLIERSRRVTMADVDAAGIIYYGSPLRWAEMLLGDWLERSGHAISAMLAANEAIPVVRTEIPRDGRTEMTREATGGQ